MLRTDRSDFFNESIALEKRTWYFRNPEHNLNHAENAHPYE